MSGETEEMTTDGKSVDSALIWTDNPELEYFRSMMTNGIDDNLASGDSLIGDSTVREMLEIGGSSPLRRMGVRDTSGLSDAESNTVDNIYIEDGSTFAKKKAFNMVFDDATIESEEDGDLIPPIMNKQEIQNQILNTPDESGDKPPPRSQPQCIFSPAQLNIPHDICHGDPNSEVNESSKIPGIIFVTDGHSSIVHTNPQVQSDQPSKKHDKKQKVSRIPRSLMICLTLTIIVASTVVAVLFYRMKMGLPELTSSSSQKPSGGSPLSSPDSPPTSQPSSLRANKRPQQPLRSPSSPPTSQPSSLRANDRPQAVTPTSYPSTAQLNPHSIPSTPPSMHPSIFPNGGKKLFPTTEPTFVTLDSPSPTAKPINSSEAPTKTSKDFPTVMPSPLSTATSTIVDSSFVDSSSSCMATISTDKICYDNGENIQISFNNCQPESSDWVGIYPARQSVSNLNQPLTWVWTCGDRFCNDSVSSGEVTIYGATGFGSYRAFLLRDNESGRGYTAYAIGNTFTMSSRCN